MKLKAAFPNVRSVGSADFEVIGIPLIGNLANGHSAVVLFFIMSGFVLSLPQLRGKPVNYPTYLIKRICRIYLPYLVALGIAIVGCYLFYNRLHGTADGTWDQSPSSHTIRQSLLMVTSYDAMHYNGAFWSIIEEMRIIPGISSDLLVFSERYACRRVDGRGHYSGCERDFRETASSSW